MRKLVSDLSKQANLSLLSVRFHQAKFLLIDYVLKDIEVHAAYRFNDTSKAMMLVLCEDLTSWFEELYKAAFYNTEPNLHQDVVESLVTSFDNYLSGFTEKVRLSNTWVNKDMISMCERIMAKHTPLLVDLVRAKLGLPADLAFTDLNNFLVKFLNHSKKVVHEIDYIITYSECNDFDPFVSVDVVDLSLFQDYSVSMPKFRLDTYKECRHLLPSSICVKSYVEASELDSNRRLSNHFEAILDSITEGGFKIICII